MEIFFRIMDIKLKMAAGPPPVPRASSDAVAAHVVHDAQVHHEVLRRK
jgi:hypothetical protein